MKYINILQVKIYRLNKIKKPVKSHFAVTLDC